MSSKETVKQIKDDAIIDIKVNKSYYLMVKASLLTILTELNSEGSKTASEFMKNLISKKYEELDPKERVFFTLTLLIGEIEKQALENDAFEEKELDVEKIKADLKSDIKKAEESNED